MQVLNKYHFKEAPQGAISIMRPSIFGNPFQIGKDGTRDEVVRKYRHWLWKKINEDLEFRASVLSLKGHDLICCCAPRVCHGDVLKACVAYLDKFPKQ